MAAWAGVDADLGQAQVVDPRDRADREQGMRPLDAAAVLQGDHDPLTGAVDRRHPGVVEHLHPLPREHLLDQLRGVRVLPGQHPVA